MNTQRYVAPKAEPVYVSRSDKNTYHANSMNQLYIKYYDSYLVQIFNDIVLKTRQRGQSVEEYF